MNRQQFCALTAARCLDKILGNDNIRSTIEEGVSEDLDIDFDEREEMNDTIEETVRLIINLFDAESSKGCKNV